MEVIVICTTVVIVFGMFTFISNKYINKLANDKDRDSLIDSLHTQVKKFAERLGQLETRGLR